VRIGLNSISKKIIVYTTFVVLVTAMVFTIITIATMLSFKSYIVSKASQRIAVNFRSSLVNGVEFYSKLLKEAMNERRSLVFLFGKLIDKRLRNEKPSEGIISDIFEEMNESLDIRKILIIDDNLKIVCHFPGYIETLSAVKFLKKNMKIIQSTMRKVVFINFHINNDGSVSYSFVYLTHNASKKPLYIYFDFRPYEIYSLIKEAQPEPYSQRCLWLVNRDGFIIYAPATKNHPEITLKDHINLFKVAKIEKRQSAGIKSAEIIAYTFRNIDKIAAYTYIKQLGWGLGLTLPYEALSAPISRLETDIKRRVIYAISLLSLVNALAIIAAILVAMFAAGRFSGAINRIRLALDEAMEAKEIGGMPVERNDEIGALARSAQELIRVFIKVWKSTGNQEKGGRNG